jgi:hypothetical protein
MYPYDVGLFDHAPWDDVSVLSTSVGPEIAGGWTSLGGDGAGGGGAVVVVVVVVLGVVVVVLGGVVVVVVVVVVVLAVVVVVGAGADAGRMSALPGVRVTEVVVDPLGST